MVQKKKVKRPEGILSAALTSVNEHYAINISHSVRHWNWLLANGCHGLAVLGTTGEANCFSVHQRMELLDVALSAGVPASVLWPGTGSCSLGDTIVLTRHACKLDVPGVLILPPFYYKNPSSQAVIDWYSRVIDGVGQSSLSIILYHNPAMSGVSFTPEIIAALLKEYPDTIVGIKDASGNIDNGRLYLREFPELSVLLGVDYLLSDLIEEGAAGCISASANLSCGLMRAIWESYDGDQKKWYEDKHEMAKENQQLVNKVRKIVSAYPTISSLKAVLSETLNDPLWKMVSLPLSPLTEIQRKSLMEKISPFISVL